MNEQALMQILLDHLSVTEKLLDDHIRLVRECQGIVPNVSPSPELSNMLVTIRAQRHRVQSIVNP
jgi:hypothetical protein